MSNESKDESATPNIATPNDVSSNEATPTASSAPANQRDVENKREETIQSPGKQLAAARKKLGLTQQQVADRLHLRLNSVMAVEQDDLEPGVSVTFNKGYVRLYAKLVQLDAQPLLDAYDKVHVQDSQPAKLQSFSRRVTREASDQRWNMVTIVVILLVLGSVIGWWVQQSDSFSDSQNFVTDTIDNLFSEDESEGDNDAIEQDPQANVTTSGDDADMQRLDTGPQIPDDAVADASQLANDETNEALDNLSQTAESLQNDAVDQALNEENDAVVARSEELQSANDELDAAIDDGADALSNSTQDALDSANAIAQNALQQTEEAVNESTITAFDDIANTSSINPQGYRINEDGTVNIVFTFADDCWVSVKDVNGETMAIGVKKKGRVMEVSGLAPVRVILGAPQNVAINFAGKDYDMSVHPGGRSANFELSVESE
jgi:cytoskeleton protein RodZ